MSSDSAGSESRADGGRPSARDPAGSRSARKTKEKRVGLWVAIVVPVVLLWLLLLFAPASSRLALGERVAGGIVATAVIVPMIWFR